ncbi:SAV_915 family protein [Amycolatopsis sp. YIM 10]|uniref:SAV_915 family protein n=1 Tax=Amycolatopsis sp. YIM 10 TaxID=2653857 RepID=UPI0012A9CCBC|nr:SAV_915 family protein [Amycolatopsis sp. YIM 10]QFU91981.1 hypothetical protein YIM_34100 [Amycolatopsis sp. YIM 10]
MSNMNARPEESVEAPPDLPPVVYLPCVDHVTDPADAVIELRRMADERLAIMAYSALDRLRSCCGEQKPWVVMPTAVLARYRQVQEFHLILLDVAIPPEDRTDGPRPQHTTA